MITDAQKRANEKYFKEHYQRLTISYPKEYCEKVKYAAHTSGESLAGYVKKAIDARMAADTLDFVAFLKVKECKALER